MIAPVCGLTLVVATIALLVSLTALTLAGVLWTGGRPL